MTNTRLQPIDADGHEPRRSWGELLCREDPISVKLEETPRPLSLVPLKPFGAPSPTPDIQRSLVPLSSYIVLSVTANSCPKLYEGAETHEAIPAPGRYAESKHSALLPELPPAPSWSRSRAESASLVMTRDWVRSEDSALIDIWRGEVGLLPELRFGADEGVFPPEWCMVHCGWGELNPHSYSEGPTGHNEAESCTLGRERHDSMMTWQDRKGNRTQDRRTAGYLLGKRNGKQGMLLTV